MKGGLDNMEIFPGVIIDIDLSMVVGLMVKLLMVLLVVLSLVMVRQESLMDKVVNLPMGKSLKTLVWVFFVVTLILTVIVVLA